MARPVEGTRAVMRFSWHWRANHPRHYCRPGWLCLLTGMLVLAAGCQNDGAFVSKLNPANLNPKEWFSKPPEAPPAPVDNYVMKGGGLEKDKSPESGTAQAELEGAKTLYSQGKYAEAEKILHRLAYNSKNTSHLCEEALFFEADCLYMQGRYPKAEATYKKLLKEFRLHGRFHDQANRRLFDIANYWLDDTREIMKGYEDMKEGKRWFVMPVSFVNFDREKPLFDIEGRAIEALEEVRLNDISGPLGEKALFYIATVKYFREEYKDADYYYSQIFENYPNGKLAAKAVKYSILCKQMITGGSEYDGRPLVEARKLIDRAGAYPELKNADGKFLERQLVSIAHQQADKDYKIAEFYKRTGHPGSAYFYYELVRRRYPGTEYAANAGKRMDELRSRLDKEAAPSGPDAATPGAVRPDGPTLGPAPRMLPSGLGGDGRPGP